MLDLIMHQGEIQARGAQQNAAIWGGALQGIGQTLAGGLERHAEESARKKQSLAFEAAINSGDPRAIISVLGPRDGPAVITALRASTPDGMKAYTDRMALGRDLARGVLATPEDMRGQAYTFARSQAIQGGVFKPEELPESFEEAGPILSQVANYGQEPAKAPGTRPITTRNADGSETTRIVADVAGQEFSSAAEPPKPETRSIDVQAADALARGDRATYDRLLKVKEEMGQADDRPRDNSPRPISPTAEAQIINRLTTQWDRVATPVRELDRQVGIMDAGLNAARRGDVNAGSQAVIMTFNKILDSLSVVREAEFLRTAAGQSMVNRIKGAIEKLSVGGAGVPLPELEKFADLAREMAAEQKKFLPAMQNRIGLTADRYGVPRELIFEAAPTPGVSPPAGGPAAGGTPGPPTVGTVMNGYRFKGGNPALPTSWERE